ncbi:hypothetical protein EJ03DRAFT_325951 [Teratosphaeria nubilosa]|uniref:Uncharacterized protein n=1 Tax=Teratosphaeria nubilosa TaxID=161662 RepID=A0A6G1LEV6_9PEZI|nr:hypothetical protein EJ03DRAFT_325951 [Teratosphaeria nubilosa]
MAMSPFTLPMLGMEALRRETVGRSRGHGLSDEEAERNAMVQAIQILGLPITPQPRPSRASRKTTSYYNSFQTACSPAHDEPPSYARAIEQNTPPRRSMSADVLLTYSCSVNAEAKVLMKLESEDPLHGLCDGEWQEYFVVVRGTLLNLHKVKESGPGKLVRSYTLQHAEVGLASDTTHKVLVPQTKLARLIPVSGRNKAYRKEPSLFNAVEQHLLRLRVEIYQLVLANASREVIYELIRAISAGIDIAHAIDERHEPHQCTVPRRRRRQPRPRHDGNISDPTTVAEQERLFREMYPSFAEPASSTRPELERTDTNVTTNTQAETVHGADEQDEIDLSIMREDFATPNSPAPIQSSGPERPGIVRQSTNSSITSAASETMIHATSPTNFSETGKWQPPNTRSPAQVQRYIRRCMPELKADAARASDVVISNGKRLKINWKMEWLEDFELQPPSYRSHKFHLRQPANSRGTEQVDATTFERANSPASQSGSANTNPRRSSTTDSANEGATGGAREEVEDSIEPIDSSLTNLDLAKTATVKEEMSPTTPKQRHIDDDQRVLRERSRQLMGAEAAGILFCF